jgi:hypothetical protein
VIATLRASVPVYSPLAGFDADVEDDNVDSLRGEKAGDAFAKSWVSHILARLSVGEYEAIVPYHSLHLSRGPRDRREGSEVPS